MADATLMYATLDRVIAADAVDEWNQKMWVEITECGSAFCYAGHLLHMQGWQAVRLPERPSWSTFGLTRDGEVLTWVAIGQRAAQELGLTDAQADALFEEENTLEDLKRLVDEIVSGEFDEPRPIVWEGEVSF